MTIASLTWDDPADIPALKNNLQNAFGIINSDGAVGMLDIAPTAYIDISTPQTGT